MEHKRIIAVACLMLLSITVICMAGPFADLVNKLADGPLSSSLHSPGEPPQSQQNPTGGSQGEEGSGGTALSGGSNNGSASAGANPDGQPGDREGYKYEKVMLNTADGPQVVHFLEVDLKNSHVVVKPVSSHATLFGYEYLSVMAGSTKAVAAVNAGFAYPNGLPGGMFYSNKILKTPASGRFPVLFLMDGKAMISDAEQSVTLKSGGKTVGSVFFNRYSRDNGLYVFTPVYGSSDRIESQHLCVIVQNGKVTGAVRSETACDIPPDGFLVAAVGTDAESKLQTFTDIGTPVEFDAILKSSEQLDGEYLSAYECGSRIIKDGQDVCPEYDPWAGGLKSREPRTAVGIKTDGTLVFVVVDGRENDLSIGATGPELVRILLDKGVQDAALLDGGASSEMIIDGTIVNDPSAGRERLLPACFAVYVN